MASALRDAAIREIMNITGKKNPWRPPKFEEGSTKLSLRCLYTKAMLRRASPLASYLPTIIDCDSVREPRPANGWHHLERRPPWPHHVFCWALGEVAPAAWDGPPLAGGASGPGVCVPATSAKKY